MKTNKGLKFKGTISPIAPRIRRSPSRRAKGTRANLPRRQFLHLAAGAASLPATSVTSFGQAYPTRPIRLVIPFPPGGVNDAIGRPWADRIGSLLGPVVVENIGGGGSRTGVSSVAKAQPDGYTILVGNTGNFVIAPIASSRLPYDPLVDFDPIYRLATAASLSWFTPLFR
jgi:tripartite-type tricarboxylate transporter receptor subunit TctC